MLGQGTHVAALTATSYQITGLTPATTYCFYVRKDCGATNGASTYAGPICFTTPLTVPSNDEPCGAVPLGSTANGTTLGATTSVQNGINLPACAPAQAPKDVWFTFTAADVNKTLVLNSPNAGMLRVFTSPDCSNGPFTQVFCQASTSNSAALGTVAITGLTVGTRYYVAVSGYGSSSSLGSFNVLGTRAVQADTQALLVYPNPSHGGQLALRLATAHEAGTAVLLNALGQQVASYPVPANSTEQLVSTKNLAAGVYTLRVALGAEVLTRKVVLE